MKALIPYLRQMRPHLGWVLLGAWLGLLTLVASIGLLSLSGWFISATALAGLAGLGAQQFNFFTPGAGVRGFAILRTAGRYGERVVSHEATFRLITRLRTWFYQQLEPLGPARLSQLGSAQLLNRLLADIGALDNLYLRVLAPTLIALSVVLLVALFLTLFLPDVALIAVVGLLVAGFVVPWLGYRLARGVGEAQPEAVAQLRVALVALVRGMADLRIYGGMARARTQIVEREAHLLATQQRMGMISALTGSLMTLVSGLTLILATLPAVIAVRDNLLAPAELALVLFCVLAAFEAVMPLPLAYQYLGKTRAAAQRLNEVVDTKPQIRFPAAGVVPRTPGSIRFDDVYFSYRSQQPVLKGISFAVAPGERLALAGHSGSGKTSLINLLVRFWDADAGVVELGGQPIAAYDESTLRAQLSVMDQPVHLFAGSVRDNLRLAGDVDDQRMRDLLASLRLLEALGPEGLDYQIGEGGSRLSGGQRKRLALARALLRPAPVLLLDEPTEGLDADTAAAVLDLLAEINPGQTQLLISHHEQVLARYPRILRLDQGRLVTPQPD
jgi:ATP-binding cassette subfamily C protein CydC